MKRDKLIIIGIMLAASLLLVATDSRVHAARLNYPIGDSRVCPPSKPKSIVGTIKHFKRFILPLWPAAASDRFLVRLANEQVGPIQIVDYALTGTDGRYKLCYADSDLLASPYVLNIRAHSGFIPDTSGTLEVRKPDAQQDPAGYSHLYSGMFAITLYWGGASTVYAPDFSITNESFPNYAFQIKDDLQSGYDRVNGDLRGNVDVEWPENILWNEQSFLCYDLPGLCTEPYIYLRDEDGRLSRFTVLHEMGHRVMYNRYGAWMPASPADYTNWCQSHSIGGELATPVGRKCIWEEDWANFFAGYVEKSPFLAKGNQNFQSTWDIGTGEAAWPTGDDTEGRVSGALWDIYDSDPDDRAGDGADFYSGGFNDIWALIDVPYRAETFEEFWNSWVSTGRSKCASTAIAENTIVYSDPDWGKCDAESHWQFNESGGSSASDSMGGHTGTLGANAGFYGNSEFGLTGDNTVSFSGVAPGNDVTVPAHANFDTASFSVSLWIRPAAVQTQGVMYKDFATWGQTTTDWRLLMNGDGRMRFDARADQYSVWGAVPAEIGRWVHVAATYDSSSREMKLYVGGRQDGATAVTQPGHLINSHSFPVVIGREEWSSFAGAIDRVKYFKRALIAAEVRMLSKDGIAANWDFHEGGWPEYQGPYCISGQIRDVSDDQIGAPFSCNSNPSLVTRNSFWAPGVDGYGDEAHAGSFWGQGPFWNSVEFGPDSRLNTPSFSVSLSFWPKTNRDEGIMYKDPAAWGIMKIQNGSGFKVRFNALSYAQIIDGPTVLSAMTWTHIVVTYDSGYDQMRLYVNGALAGTRTGVPDINGNYKVRIGRNEYLNFDGSIDLVKYYPRALSAAETLAIYQSP